MLASLHKGKPDSKDIYQSWALLSTVLLMVLSTFEGSRMAGSILTTPQSSTLPIFFGGAAR